MKRISAQVLALFAPIILILGVLSGHIVSSWISKDSKIEYITVTEPQVHTVVKYQAVLVPDVSCPREDSCEYQWKDGEARLVEVEH